MLGLEDSDELLAVREDCGGCRHEWPEWTEDFLEI